MSFTSCRTNIPQIASEELINRRMRRELSLSYTHALIEKSSHTHTQLIRSRNGLVKLFPSETTSVFCGPDFNIPALLTPDDGVPSNHNRPADTGGLGTWWSDAMGTS